MLTMSPPYLEPDTDMPWDVLKSRKHPIKNWKLIKRLIKTIEKMSEELTRYRNKDAIFQFGSNHTPITRQHIIDEFYR